MTAIKPSKARKAAAAKSTAPPAAAAPPPAVPAERKLPKGKLGQLITLLSTPEGATISQMMDLTSWQSHSVRGTLAGAVKKKFGYTVTSEKTGVERVYRIATEAA